MKAHRPSLTARSVALQRGRLGRPASPHGDPDAERRLYDDIRFPVPLLSKGVPMLARTEFVDAEVVRALDHGVTQVVIVGAGYDGRALRFREPGVRYFELDHPATQADKRQRLTRLGISTEGITFVPVDLTAGEIGHMLEAAGHVPTVDSLFICEGLLGYLPSETIDAVCGGLRKRATATSTLVANFRVVEPETSLIGRVRRAGVEALLAAIGEHRATEFHPGDAEAFLARAGWQPRRTVKRDASRQEGGSYGLIIAAEPVSGGGA